MTDTTPSQTPTDELTRLRKENARLREALKLFVEECKWVRDEVTSIKELTDSYSNVDIVGLPYMWEVFGKHFDAARTALSGKEGCDDNAN